MSATISATSAPTAAAASLNFASASVSPEERMLALVVYSQAAQTNEAKTSIELSAEQLEKLREQIMKALDDARAAKKESGFWGGLSKILGSDLASLASAVAALAMVVGSGGAAAPILAVIATAASFAAEHAEDLGIPMEVAMAIAIAASVAALCVGDTKGLFKVSEQVKTVASDVKTCATAAAVTFKAEGALCGAAQAGYERAAKYADADARHSDGLTDLVNADMEGAFDRLSEAISRQGSAFELTSRIQQQTAASGFAIVNNWGGVA